MLKGVDFTLQKASIHALLGENGAGKSTLMNILSGILPHDQGDIMVQGNISFIHQELSLVNDLNIYENLFLGAELKKGPLLNRKEMAQKAQAALERMGVAISPHTLVGDLSPSYKQMVEIARAIMKESEVIIMDEPTTSLTDVEIEKIFAVMERLKAQGLSLIFISHKLNEVLRICDSYTIMRDGLVVAKDQVTPATTEQEMSTHMVGKDVATDGIYQPRPLGPVVLALENLTRPREYQGVNLTVKKGEIVGVTGLMGDGRTELFASVIGANYPYQGDVLVEGKKVAMKTTATARAQKIAYVPKNRKENGIIKDMSIAENMTLPELGALSKYGVIQRDKLNKTVDKYVDLLKIKLAHPTDLITSLSGGNQQKVVLSKALGTNPAVVVLDNPTQGVDIGAKMEIYRQIIDLAAQGLSFVVLSSEIPELQRICDRAYVMFSGQIRQEFTREEITEENIMLVATGGVYNVEKAAENTGGQS